MSTKAKGAPWSAPEEARLRELYPTTNVRDLAPIFRRSPEAVKSRATLLRIPKVKQRKLWTASDDWMMRAFYPHVSNPDLAQRLRCSVLSLYRRAHLLGVHKSEVFLREFCRLRPGATLGAQYRYRKGHVSSNKGVRRPGFFVGRMRETQFRKGQQPHNVMPLWSFRFNSMGYLMLKTGKPAPKPNNGWEWVHKLIWEQANGPLPDFSLARLWWKDGDHGNCALSNLELVTAQEHMARTTVHNFPAPLKQVIQLKGALKRRIGRMEKQNAEEHDRRSPQSPVCDDRSIAG